MITATLILALLVVLVATDANEPSDDFSTGATTAWWRSPSRAKMAGFGDPALPGAAKPRHCQALDASAPGAN